MEVKEIAMVVGVVKDVILSAAAIVTAVVAVNGVTSWLRELRGKAEFDTALALMRATYGLRESVASCRSPWISAAEFPPDYKALEASNEAKGKAYGHVFRVRWSPVSAALSEFDARALEAEAIWGKDVVVAVEPLRKNVRTLYAAIQAFIDNIYSDGEDFDHDRPFGQRIQREVFAPVSATDNELSDQIAASVKRIETFVSPHLRRS
ncbi:hypothetical protein [Burkholderia cenocepacia]|uniref:hypothetical protein n=1 Tax=Burkholderia cenocepacia TaxID=95486 RepID=UPI0022314318|nr:hypothetical protein [Burkholderia cenocepacia]MCW3677814.1 hypothetical protein [Burkholderia cenocepacia]